MHSRPRKVYARISHDEYLSFLKSRTVVSESPRAAMAHSCPPRHNDTIAKKPKVFFHKGYHPKKPLDGRDRWVIEFHGLDGVALYWAPPQAGGDNESGVRPNASRTRRLAETGYVTSLAFTYCRHIKFLSTKLRIYFRFCTGG